MQCLDSSATAVNGTQACGPIAVHDCCCAAHTLPCTPASSAGTAQSLHSSCWNTYSSNTGHAATLWRNWPVNVTKHKDGTEKYGLSSDELFVQSQNFQARDESLDDERQSVNTVLRLLRHLNVTAGMTSVAYLPTTLYNQLKVVRRRRGGYSVTLFKLSRHANLFATGFSLFSLCRYIRDTGRWCYFNFANRLGWLR